MNPATLRSEQLFRLALARRQRSLDGTDECGRHGYGHDAQHDDLEVLLYEGNAAEEVSHQHKQAHPGDAAHGVEEGSGYATLTNIIYSACGGFHHRAKI